MAVQIRVKDNKILVDLIQCPEFDTYVQLLRSFGHFDRVKHKAWIISPSKIQALRDALYDLDLDVVIETERTKTEIESIRKPAIVYSFERIPFELSDLKVPPLTGKHPYEDFQFEDLVKCVNHSYYALFNEQGTGKSWILISALEILRQKKNLKKVLFVTSSSGVINIKREFKKFSNFDSSRIAIGNRKNRRPFVDSVDIVICNYRSFLLISDEYQKDRNKKVKKYRSTPIPIQEWLSGEYSAIILDESHNIANKGARQTQTLHLVREYFDRAYLATGTPADSEEKYYSQLTFLHPTLTHNYTYEEWLEEYADIGNRFSSMAINFFKKEKKPELTTIVRKVSSRRLADECLELPEHLKKTILIELTDLQEQIYQELVKERIREIQRAQAMDLNTVRSLFPYFIEGVDNPCMLVDNPNAPESVKKLAKRFSFEDHSKLEALDELLEKHAKSSKIIIWTYHPSVGFALKDYLDKKNYKTLVINGKSKPRGFKGELDDYKDSVVEEFKTTDVQILIAGIPVLNSSITIIEANVQIYFENEFNYVNVDQSRCRIRRIGQEKTVYTYEIVADNTLDVIRQATLHDKEFISKKFGSKEYLDQEDLREIFNGVL